ncbi:transposase [Pirellulales bacterium]|nr:transposase [Pirellulales bacterium]
MPRKPRIQFPGAIYHVVTRGDGRRELFHDDDHYARFTKGLRDEVQRSDWQVLAFCWMPNHVHLLLTTPEPNLSSGMQHWLSGYANWYAKRNRRTGHLYQGRYKAFLVEDANYYWPLSRYIHLNPCVGKSPLCDKPDAWKHSSYAGYARKRERLDFVDYAALLEAWTGEFGGRDAAAAYRRFVSQGLASPSVNPLDAALEKWVIGSKAFLKRMVKLAEQQDPAKQGRLTRRTRAYSIQEIVDLVAQQHQVDGSQYVGFRCSAPGRDMAALVCRRFTSSTLAELSAAFGLGHPDSAANLVRRARRNENESSDYRKQLKNIEKVIMKTENQV